MVNEVVKFIINNNLNICISKEDLYELKISQNNYHPSKFLSLINKGLIGKFVLHEANNFDINIKYGCNCWIDKSILKGKFKFSNEIIESVNDVKWSNIISYEDYSKLMIF